MERFTRLCFDPWNYLEFRPDGSVAPCCAQHSVEAAAPDLYALRQGEAFRDLRRSLYDGELDGTCRSCALREKVPVEAFRAKLARHFADLGEPLAAARQLAILRIDITERCNLRCTYCAVSQPDYAGTALAVAGGDQFPPTRLAELVDRLAATGDIEVIAMNGHGETTTYPEWHAYCRKLLDTGHRLSIISNFAKDFSEVEVDTLARFESISVSLDTVDRDLLKQVRRKVGLATILLNIAAIRTRAVALGLNPPRMSISAGIYDKNALSLANLAYFAVAMQFTGITFWKLVKYADIGVPGDVTPLDRMPAEFLDAALRCADQARDILFSHGLAVHFTGDFIEEMRNHGFVELRIIAQQGNSTAGWQLRLSLEPKTEEQGERELKLFAAVKTAAGFQFVDRQGEWVPLAASRLSEAAAFCTTAWSRQELDVHVPPLPDGLSSASLYLAAGPSAGYIVGRQNFLELAPDSL